MKRRSFLALASIAPIGLAHSADGSLRLEVGLIDEKDQVEEKTIQTEDGEITIYSFNGDELPRWIISKKGYIMNRHDLPSMC